MTEKLKVGVAAAGQIAKVLHIHEWEESPDCELIAIYNGDLSFIPDVIEEYEPRGVKFYDEFDEFLATGVQAISLCERNFLHAPLTIRALKAGVHVLCEKPMATNLEDAQAMIDAGQEGGVLLMIDQSQRYSPVHRKAKEVIESGLLGKMYHIQTAFGHSGPENWTPTAQWFFQKKYSGFGPLADLGVHKADLIRFLTGKEVKRVCGFRATLEKENTDVEDNSVGLLEFSDGTMGTLCTSWTTKGTEDNSFTAFCEKGVLRISVEPGNPLVVYSAELGGKVTFDVPPVQTNVEGQWFLGVVQDFVDAILGRKPCPIPGEEGYKALEIIVALDRSCEAGQWVELPLL